MPSTDFSQDPSNSKKNVNHLLSRLISPTRTSRDPLRGTSLRQHSTHQPSLYTYFSWFHNVSIGGGAQEWSTQGPQLQPREGLKGV